MEIENRDVGIGPLDLLAAVGDVLGDQMPRGEIFLGIGQCRGDVGLAIVGDAREIRLIADFVVEVVKILQL